MNKLLLACSLGDGHISKDGTFEILHQSNQEEFVSKLYCPIWQYSFTYNS